MEKKIDYRELYILQDKILKLVFSLDNGFYLTGGTALHRFYYNLRYSDDLDFFSYSDTLFKEYIIEILNLLEKEKIEYRYSVESKDFHRIIIEDLLQIDFVNDRVYREGRSNIIDGKKIDNHINILANKVTAILGRDEEKDLFDIFALAYNQSFLWSDILEIANKKSNIDKDVLIYRLKSFPLSWLDNIKIIQDIEIDKKTIEILCEDILNEKENSFMKNITRG